MKENVREQIFYVCKSIPKMTESRQYNWGEVKRLLSEKNIELQDDDEIEIGIEDGWLEESSSRDAHYYIAVNRWREFTPEEKRKFKEELEEHKRQSKLKRYADYLKLKEEFEPKT